MGGLRANAALTGKHIVHVVGCHVSFRIELFQFLPEIAPPSNGLIYCYSSISKNEAAGLMHLLGYCGSDFVDMLPNALYANEAIKLEPVEDESRDMNGLHDAESRDIDGSHDAGSRDIDGSHDAESRDIDGSHDAESCDIDGSHDAGSRDIDGSHDVESRDIDGSHDAESRDDGLHEVESGGVNEEHDKPDYSHELTDTLRDFIAKKNESSNGTKALVSPHLNRIKGLVVEETRDVDIYNNTSQNDREILEKRYLRDSRPSLCIKNEPGGLDSPHFYEFGQRTWQCQQLISEPENYTEDSIDVTPAMSHVEPDVHAHAKHFSRNKNSIGDQIPTSVRRRKQRTNSARIIDSFNELRDVSYIRSLHKVKRVVKCPICEYDAGRQSHLVKHMRKHTGERPYKCTLCDYSSTQSNNLTVHMRRHTEERPYKCTVCAYGFSTLANVMRHMLRHHTEGEVDGSNRNSVEGSTGIAQGVLQGGSPEIEEVQSLQLDDIRIDKITEEMGMNELNKTKGDNFESLNDTTEQLAHIFPDNPDVKLPLALPEGFQSNGIISSENQSTPAVVNEHCNDASDRSISHSPNDLIKSRLLSNADKLFQCSVCEYCAGKHSHLIKHMRTHTGERPYKCPYCNYSSTQSNNLTVHIRRHTGERPYKCEMCGRGFCSLGNVIRHRHLHTGEKPYRCTQCNYTCGDPSHLTRHKKLHGNTYKYNRNYRKRSDVLSLKECTKIREKASVKITEEGEDSTENVSNMPQELSQNGSELHSETEAFQSVRLSCDRNFLESSSHMQQDIFQDGSKLEASCNGVKSSIENLGEVEEQEMSKNAWEDHIESWSSNTKELAPCHGKDREESVEDGKDRSEQNILESSNEVADDTLGDWANVDGQSESYIKNESNFEEPESNIDTNETLDASEYLSPNSGDFIKSELVCKAKKSFKCTICEYHAGRPSNLIKHIRKHTGEKPFKCLHCDYSSTQSNNLTVHMRRHTGERPYKCDMCERGFCSLGNLIRHRHLHTGERPYRCTQCNYTCGDPSHLTKHKKQHGNTYKYNRNYRKRSDILSLKECTKIREKASQEFTEDCEDSTENVSNMQQELPQNRSELRLGTEAFKSVSLSCDRNFLESSSRVQQDIPQDGSKVQSKPVQSGIFSYNGLKSSLKNLGEVEKQEERENALEDHNESWSSDTKELAPSLGEDVEKSEGDGKDRSEQNILESSNEVADGTVMDWPNVDGQSESYIKNESNCADQESNTVTNEALLDASEYLFTNSGDFVQTEFVGKAKKSFKCTICEYHAGKPSNLIKHFRKHTGEKPFRCSHCDYSSTQSNNLTVHMRRHTGERPYRCAICGHDFASLGNLERHMRSHTDITRYKCSYCTYSCDHMSLLTNHLKIHK